NTLWRRGKPRAEDVLTLGRCLRERAPAKPSWALRVAAALARLGSESEPGTRAYAQQLLHACLPALDTSLEAIAGTEAIFERFLIRLFETLPADLAAPRLLRMTYDPRVGEPFAWQLADRVIARGLAAAGNTPAAEGALARWLYIESLLNTIEHRQIEPDAAIAGLEALAASEAGETRKLQAATALLDDLAQPTAIRRAALALLAR